MQIQKKATKGLIGLGPELVLGLVEQNLGVRCTNLFRPLASYINRVYEIETEERQRLVVKFYRPGRWSKEAILEEHRFLLDLSEKEVPVIAPLILSNGSSLLEDDGLFYAVFPYCGGRSVDEFTDDQWLQIGHLLGRIHLVGEMCSAAHRPQMNPVHSTQTQLEFLLRSALVPDDIKVRLKTIVDSIITDITPLFRDTDLIRIHGDCHFANLIHRPGESLYFIDFDDMAMGSPVQDMWMLLPGPPEECPVELDLLLEGYETFRRFDRRSLRLIEPLRVMRFIHYMAWCTLQVEEDGETKAIDGFGSHEYWQNELADLVDQQKRIAEAKPILGNC